MSRDSYQSLFRPDYLASSKWAKSDVDTATDQVIDIFNSIALERALGCLPDFEAEVNRTMNAVKIYDEEVSKNMNLMFERVKKVIESNLKKEFKS